MILNYFRIACRKILLNKGISFIHIVGLATGMAAFVLIATWVYNEWTFEKFHQNKKSLYKVWNRTTIEGEVYAGDITAGPLAQVLANDYPEVERSSRIYWSSERLFQYKNKHIKARGNDVDPAFLSMFTFPLLQGDRHHALDEVNSVVITENLAQKLFGDKNPMLQMITLDNQDSYQVTGILKNLPANTEFDFEYLIPLAANEKIYSNNNSWGTNTFYTYVQLQPGTKVDEFNSKVKDAVSPYVADNQTEIFIQPLEKWHLYSRFENGQFTGGRIETVRLMVTIGFLILLIACINFMNLSTAQSARRAKEVGIRKVIGAGKKSLVTLFLCESAMITFMAAILALFLAALALPAFSRLIEKPLTINFLSPLFWMSFLVFILFTALLEGSYPAFFLSNFQPVRILKGLTGSGPRLFSARKVLVIVQFSVGIVLIVATIIIYRQINFVQKRDSGYRAAHLIEVPVEGDISKNYGVIEKELVNSGAVIAMSKTGFGVTMEGSTGSGYYTGGAQKEQENLQFSIFRTSGNFVKTLGLTLLAGRDLDFNLFPADSASVLINETAARKMNLTDPVGKTIQRGDMAVKVAGVFKDFIIGSPYAEIKPMIVFANRDYNYNTLLRLSTTYSLSKSLDITAKIFKRYNPAYPFTYHFVDREYARKFRDEQQAGVLAAVFAGLAIFISCLGLFGLAAFVAEKRAKEIGIRKVLGARSGEIAAMLSREFVGLVLIAILIATPVAWWAMHQWLQDFAYRIPISWITFLAAGFGAIFIAVITVSWQALRAAMANPVKSLRSE